MRVLLTTDTVGGVWTFTSELANGLLERSHAVALVSLGQSPSPDHLSWSAETSARFGDLFAYTPSDLPLEWMSNNDRAYAGAEPLILETARRFRADLLHTNQFCFGALPLPFPKLITAHSDVLTWADACKPDGFDTSPWLTRYKDLVQRGLDSADAVVAPTHWMLRALARHFPLPSNTSVIPNGRDLPLPPSPAARKLQAVTVGRLWDPAKGISLLAGVSAPFPIFVAGQRDHGHETAPPSLGRTTDLGHLPEQDLLHLLRSSSIYLALSIYEPFGLAPLEAALCGCAIVARDIPSLREVWGSSALYFTDADTLTSLLSSLASNPPLLADFQGRAGHHAASMSRSHMVESYIRLYTHLLAPAHTVPAPRTATVHTDA